MTYDPRYKPTLYEKLLLTALAVLTLTVVVVFELSNVRIARIEDRQASDRERGYAGRATTCRLLVGLGLLDPQKAPTSDPCLDPNVLRFYDPNAADRTFASKQSVTAQVIVCQFLQQEAVRFDPPLGIPPACTAVLAGLTQ